MAKLQTRTIKSFDILHVKKAPWFPPERLFNIVCGREASVSFLPLPDDTIISQVLLNFYELFWQLEMYQCLAMYF